MEVGNVYNDVICESFKDPETYRLRIRPAKGQVVPTNLVVESLKVFREKYPEGTRFMANEIKVCQKPNGRIYLRAKDQMLFVID